jgi:hypothetical protein
MSSEFLYFNGIDGNSGSYLLPPLSAKQVAAIAANTSLDDAQIKELKWWHQRITEGHYGVKEGVDPKNLAETGWGVIFAHDENPAVREALSLLLDWRRSQASQNIEYYYKEYVGPDGYRPGQSKGEFLSQKGAGPGPADPEKVPYYLLIVGDPEKIPYRFQTQLDIQYAVGRIHFNKLEDYAAYAESVVQSEKQKLSLPRQAAFFGVANADDRATQLSVSELVTPLAEYLQKDKPDWQVRSILRDQATKDNLNQLLKGKDAPALFFSASHGMSFPNADPRQLPHQGALLCQDWPGPQNWRGPIPEEFYYSADDLDSDVNLLGLIAFTFACYGAGTPKQDEFAQQAFKQRADIAPRAFLSNLPLKMLSHPKGGALAVIGHVERAWGYSFLWGKSGRQLAVFESSMKRLVEGHPVGSAFERFNERYAEISSDLSMVLEDIQFGKAADELELAGMWTANNDARNYVILGDPAVRMMVAESTENLHANRETITITAPAKVVTEVTLPPEEQPAGSTAQPVLPGFSEEISPDYGLIDSFKQVQSGVSTSLQQFVNKLGTFLTQALDDASTLEVTTYVSEDLNEVIYENGKFQGAYLRAVTRMKIDGDTLVCVPEQAGEVDQELWKVHTDMVQLAQDNRMEFLRTVVSAATGLVNMIKPS